MPKFPSLDWFQEFINYLEENESFQSVMSHFDGAIKLKVGEEVIWMKIYRGKVLEVLDIEAEFGSTFAITGPPREWERLLTMERNPFGEQLMAGLININGNFLEAIRVIDGVNALLESLREKTSKNISLTSGGATDE